MGILEGEETTLLVISEGPSHLCVCVCLCVSARVFVWWVGGHESERETEQKQRERERVGGRERDLHCAFGEFFPVSDVEPYSPGGEEEKAG